MSTNSAAKASGGSRPLNASQGSLTQQVTRTSSMESLESSMSTSESNAGDVENNRLMTVLQENAVLRSELELMRLRCKNLVEENRKLRQASVTIQAQAEQEEEFISNTLLKKIHSLKKEKEALAMNYEQEEEFLTNDLSRKLAQLRQEKVQLEQTLEQEQEQQIAKLTKKIERLEKETSGKQDSLDKLRREKIDLENTLEQEQEMLVNRLWKRMDKVEQEKRELEAKLGATPPPSPSDQNSPAFLNSRILQLSNEVEKLRKMLSETKAQSKERIQQIEEEEKALKEENMRLQRRLLRETERREQMTRQLSESESSIEMDEERYFNEMTSGRVFNPSSPSPYSPSPTRRSLSPSPALFAAASGGMYPPPTSPLRGRTQSFGTYPHIIHGNHHLQSVSASHIPGGSGGSSGGVPLRWLPQRLLSVATGAQHTVQGEEHTVEVDTSDQRRTSRPLNNSIRFSATTAQSTENLAQSEGKEITKSQTLEPQETFTKALTTSIPILTVNFVALFV